MTGIRDIKVTSQPLVGGGGMSYVPAPSCQFLCCNKACCTSLVPSKWRHLKRMRDLHWNWCMYSFIECHNTYCEFVESSSRGRSAPFVQGNWLKLPALTQLPAASSMLWPKYTARWTLAEEVDLISMYSELIHRTYLSITSEERISSS